MENGELILSGGYQIIGPQKCTEVSIWGRKMYSKELNASGGVVLG